MQKLASLMFVTSLKHKIYIFDWYEILAQNYELFPEDIIPNFQKPLDVKNSSDRKSGWLSFIKIRVVIFLLFMFDANDQR